MTDDRDYTSISVYKSTRDRLQQFQTEHGFETYDETIRYLLSEPRIPDDREHDPRHPDSDEQAND